MSTARRRIGVLTGGGDCPGLNAVLRGIVLRSAQLGHEVVGIENGFQGLLPETEGHCRALWPVDVEHLLPQGGTILGATNKGNPLAYVMPDGTTADRGDDVLGAAKRLGLASVIAIGGDGTQSIAYELGLRGLPVIGVPKTIDNDLAATYETFGFATAVQFVSEALDRLRTTAASHERIMVIEVMGREAGWIALHSGIAGGAHAILVPEIPYDPAIVVRVLRERAKRGAGFGLVVVAEGAAPKGEDAPTTSVVGPTAGHAKILGGAGRRAAELIGDQAPEVELRVTVLGHLQRGGSPCATDRILATRFGVAAADAADRGQSQVLVAWDP
ncbi:MAG TPA: ATP-dependent 6-phosphofructokinase, partial [Nannocystaceae bacterium]|nr:ATP-dependent 6-phosphofructokinase [Nannocystaceae bacterium]